MNKDTTYNGWRNRTTWLVNLWFEPNAHHELEAIKESLEQRVNDLANSKSIVDQFLADHINIEKIDWHELAEHLNPYPEYE